MSNYFSKTSIANKALDLVGKDPLLDLDSSTSPLGKLVQRNYDTTLLRCLRKSPWPWCLTRRALNPSGDSPLNEFAYAFDLPGDFVKMVKVWPTTAPYKIEGGQILCDENSLTIKYVDNRALVDPSVMDPAFAEYFAHELAVAISYKLTDSVALKNDLRKEAKERFLEAAALFSQEDTEDALPEAFWVTDRYGSAVEDGTIRIEGLE